jgi:hypothetical protein
VCPPSAKHRVWTYENQKKGTVGKSTTSIVKVLMAGGADVKMRRLGPLVEALEESPPSLILEGEGDSTLQDNKVLEAIYE